MRRDKGRRQIEAQARVVARCPSCREELDRTGRCDCQSAPARTPVRATHFPAGVMLTADPVKNKSHDYSTDR